MKLTIKNIPVEKIKADVLVFPVLENGFPENLAIIDLLVGGLIKKLFKSKEFTGKHGSNTLLHFSNISADRILLTGLGKQLDITPEIIRQAGGRAFSFLKTLGVENIALGFKEINSLLSNLSMQHKPSSYFLEGGLLSLYSFNKYKKPDDLKQISNIVILGDEDENSLRWIDATVSATKFARDLINTPSNDMTPAVLAETAHSLASSNVRINVLNTKESMQEGMHAFLSVARGSAQMPKFIVLNYKGDKGDPYVLIGKSITFDSGGISLKPSAGMEKMKYDMAGGAVTLSVIKAASRLELPVNIIGILPAAENMPGGNASKPGDIVTSITGKTIEIVNTDAEGRLAIADAIGYAIKHFKPKGIIDIATLTGACRITFGNEAVAMMGNNQDLMEKLKKASEETYERVWQMPLYDEYKDYIKSDIADIKNSGGKNAALLTAGFFLKEFADNTPWVHLDIAGVAWNDKEKPYLSKGATGIGVRLILNFLKEN
jgi:leucyl aminopeptidase